MLDWSAGAMDYLAIHVDGSLVFVGVSHEAEAAEWFLRAAVGVAEAEQLVLGDVRGDTVLQNRVDHVGERFGLVVFRARCSAGRAVLDDVEWDGGRDVSLGQAIVA
jgi:hypothetical protein